MHISAGPEEMELMRGNKAWGITMAILLAGACTLALFKFAWPSVDETAWETAVEQQSGYIKYARFDVPYAALEKAMKLDISTHGKPIHLGWVEMLACLAAQYGGNWKKYKAADLDHLAKILQSGQTIGQLTARLKYYSYYHEVYSAVLSNFLGDYQIEVPNSAGPATYQVNYGLKVFSPIAKNYGYSHYDDFGDSRSFGFARRHLGNDLLGSVGTPIVAVEGGTVECMGWNVYGGWRIGIRSFDNKRYYYYAHLRRNHPYQTGLKQGDVVKSGDVIGYLGMTGYSTRENVNNMTKPHLHFGLELVFDETQKESNNEIWIDVYDIINLLSQNRVQVKRVDATKEYTRVLDFMDLRYQSYYNGKTNSTP